MCFILVINWNTAQFDIRQRKPLFCNTSIFYFCDTETPELQHLCRFIHSSVLRSIRAEVRLDKVNAVINNCNKYQVNVQHIFHCIQLFVRMSFHRLHQLLSKKTARKMKRLPLIAAVNHFKINIIIKIKIIYTHTHKTLL